MDCEGTDLQNSFGLFALSHGGSPSPYLSLVRQLVRRLLPKVMKSDPPWRSMRVACPIVGMPVEV